MTSKEALYNLVQCCFNDCDSDEVLNYEDIILKDLEVLDILKKYLHLKDKLWHGWSYQAIELDKINDIEATQSKEMETDLKILKQWLNN